MGTGSDTGIIRTEIFFLNYSGQPWSHSDRQAWMTTSPESTYEGGVAESLPADDYVTGSAPAAAVFDPCDVSNQVPYPDVTQLPGVVTALCVVYLLVIFLAVCGNALVILTVWRNAHMHTVTNYYIVNLAVSDLLVSTLVMPFKLLEYTGPCQWNVFANPLLCPIISYILPIFVFASVLTLVAISLERYYAIVHPLSAMKFNSKARTKKILAATWALPVILASPYTFSRSYPFVISSEMGSISRQICNDRFDEIDELMYGAGATDRFRRGFFVFLFLAMYLIPMLVILATCVRIAVCLLQPIAVRRWPPVSRKETGRRHEENKRKVARMVIVIAVAFIVSWSPFYLSTLVSQIQSISGQSFLRERNFLFTMLTVHLCGFVNSCINPFIYTGMSKKFRRSFRKILGACICCRLTNRFLRFRNSFSRGTSAAFTSSLRHSMTEVRNADDLALSEAASSDGSHCIVRPVNNAGAKSTGRAGSNCAHPQGGHPQPHQRRSQHGHAKQEQLVSLLCVSPESKQPRKNGLKVWKARDSKGVFIKLKTVRAQPEMSPARPQPQPSLPEALGGAEGKAANPAAAERTDPLCGDKTGADVTDDQGEVTDKLVPVLGQDHNVCTATEWSKMASNGGLHITTPRDCSSADDLATENCSPATWGFKHTAGQCDDILHLGLSQAGQCVQL